MGHLDWMMQEIVKELRNPNGDFAAILRRHKDVAGVSLGLICNYDVCGVSLGYARVSTGEVMTPEHYLECASLSKTVATAFALEYFRGKGIDFHSTPANVILERAGSPWRITLPPMITGTSGKSPLDVSWPNHVTLAMLVNHTALGMHYVHGIPMSDVSPPKSFPDSLDFLDGTNEKYGYKKLFVERQPGATFEYSGGGFIVLQHLIECLEFGNESKSGRGIIHPKTIEEITRPWLDSVGLRDFTFSNQCSYCAFGHLQRRKEVAPTDGGRLAFPAFAAGGLCTPAALANFLAILSQAYHQQPVPTSAVLSVADRSPRSVSQHTALDMLGESALQDKGAVAFIRGHVGLGVFVAKAGDNKFMLHQAANEGFRGVYLVCFDGPDQGNGFVLLCNGDNPAVLFQCEACRYLLGNKCFNFSGVNFDGLPDIKQFDYSTLKQETIANLGLKELVLEGFISTSSPLKMGKMGLGVSTSSPLSKL